MQDINTFRNQILILMQLSRSMPGLPILEIYNNRNFLMGQVLGNYHKSRSPYEMVKIINQSANTPVPNSVSPLAANFDPLTKFEEEIPTFDRTRSDDTCITKSEEVGYEDNLSSDSMPSPVEQKKEVKEEHLEEMTIQRQSQLVKLEPEEEEENKLVEEETHKEEEEDKGLLKQSKKIVKEKISLKNPKINNSEDVESKEKGKKVRAKKEFWKEEEDAKLMELLEVYGPKWTKIGRQIGGKSGKQTRDRYMNTLRPGINHEDWTEEEEKQLFALLKFHGKKWCTIATHMPGRTENQVKNKYYCLSNKKNGKNPNPWHEFDDELHIDAKRDASDNEEEEDDIKTKEAILADQSILKSLPLKIQEGLLQISKAF